MVSRGLQSQCPCQIASFSIGRLMTGPKQSTPKVAPISEMLYKCPLFACLSNGIGMPKQPSSWITSPWTSRWPRMKRAVWLHLAASGLTAQNAHEAIHTERKFPRRAAQADDPCTYISWCLYLQITQVQLSATYVVEDGISADAAADAGGRSKVNAKLPECSFNIDESHLASGSNAAMLWKWVSAIQIMIQTLLWRFVKKHSHWSF